MLELSRPKRLKLGIECIFCAAYLLGEIVADSKTIRDEDFEEAELRRVAESMYSDEEFPSPTPLWYRIVMFALMGLGIAWIMTFYISQYAWPIPSAGNWNIGIGVGLMMVGLMMTTRWR